MSDADRASPAPPAAQLRSRARPSHWARWLRTHVRPTPSAPASIAVNAAVIVCVWAICADARPEPQPAEADSEEIDLLTFDERNYFTSGFTENVQVKFQFSVKYELWPNAGPHAAFFGYSQQSLWDLWDFEGSSPFKENNYSPSVFYAYRHDSMHEQRTGCAFRMHRIGLVHESNGESHARSRGWNRLRGDSRFGCMGVDGQFIEWTMMLWLPFGLEDNRDITDYLGFGAWTVRVGSPDHRRWFGTFDVSATLRKGVARNGSVLGEAAWKPGYARGRRAWRFTPYLYTQLFAGNGETLLSYDESRLAFRVGVGFWDRTEWASRAPSSSARSRTAR